MTKTVNKEAFRMLALEIGLNAACRKLAVPIPTGKSWARRGGWKLPKRSGGRPCRRLSASSLNPIADALVATHKELEERTKSGLAQATARAAEAAAKAAKPLEVSSTAQLRDLAASAARVFGWDKGPQTAVQVNEFRITQNNWNRCGHCVTSRLRSLLVKGTPRRPRMVAQRHSITDAEPVVSK
jgi:hypothetical protein